MYTSKQPVFGADTVSKTKVYYTILYIKVNTGSHDLRLSLTSIENRRKKDEHSRFEVHAVKVNIISHYLDSRHYIRSKEISGPYPIVLVPRAKLTPSPVVSPKSEQLVSTYTPLARIEFVYCDLLPSLLCAGGF